MSMKQIGEFTVTAVSDGVLNSSHDVILGLDPDERVRLTGVPAGQPVPLDVNCFVIRHGGRTMLSDAGSGHTMGPTLGKLPANLRAMGVPPESIDDILLTHLHPDHSLGLVDDKNAPIFSKAQIVLHEKEAAFWLDRTPLPTDSERVQRGTKAQRVVTAPYRDRMRRVSDGEVMPGISALLWPGHTPGHTNWLIQSGADRLLIWGDIVHLASVQVPRPDAALVFDVDPALAKASRQRVFDWVADEHVLVAGAHLPFPGFARLERAGSGFVFRVEH